MEYEDKIIDVSVSSICSVLFGEGGIETGDFEDHSDAMASRRQRWPLLRDVHRGNTKVLTEKCASTKGRYITTASPLTLADLSLTRCCASSIGKLMKPIIAVLAVLVPSVAWTATFDWRFEQFGRVCTAERTTLAGDATITFLKDTTYGDQIFVKLTSPAWSAQSMTNREVEIRYRMFPYRDDTGEFRPALAVQLEPTKVAAKAMVETVDGHEQGAYGFVLSRKFVDEINRKSKIGLRIAIYYEQHELSNWMNIDQRIMRNLDRCTDPFSK